MPEVLRYPNILRAIARRPWAIDDESIEWAAICEVAALRALGGRLEADEITRRLEAARQRNGPRSGSQTSGTAVAVIPLYGTISPRSGMMGDTSGGVGLDAFGADFDAALADPGVDAIVIEVDSPGGTVDQVPEMAAKVRGARGGPKPIFAIANTQALSAAYWIAAQAEELYVTTSGFVGSIGVFSAHHDLSAAMEAAGEKVTLITSSVSPFKTEGNKYAPLGDDAAAEMQRLVNAFGDSFAGDVAKGRKVALDTVRSSFGKGRAVAASDALAAGMVNGIETLDNVIRLAARSATSRRREATASADAGALSDAADLGAGMPWRSRVALAVSLATGTLEHGRDRLAVREAAGRQLSAEDRAQLSALAGALTELASEEPPAEPKPDTAPDDDGEPTPPPATPAPAVGAFARLRLAQAEAEMARASTEVRNP